MPAFVLSALVLFEVRAFREPRDAIRRQAHHTTAVAAAEAAAIEVSNEPLNATTLGQDTNDR